MNTGFRNKLSVGLCVATIVAALLLVPTVSQAQYYNTATGTDALTSNSSGQCNTADGFEALASNTTGSFNIANGFLALVSNTTGTYNTANGCYALYYNTTGSRNEANGVNALYFNTTGTDNAANGNGALYANTTGSYNTADGFQALLSNTTGHYNIGLGQGAGFNITTGSNNIAIGNSGSSADSGIIRIGTKGTQKQTYIAGINGVAASGGVAVYINANGQLGTLTSSRRFKNHIKEMGSVSDKLMQLRPVTFRYKDSAENGPHALQYGLIAEEVARVYPDLVQYDQAGKPFTVYYHLLTPMLLNELQKAHRQALDQKSDLALLKRENAALKLAQQSQGAELTALKQSQQQQLTALTKLSALVQASRKTEAMQRTAVLAHQ